eukprot:TRINITY_DN1815_c0_g1_i2.p2 TRINITY_DN1815_c0_g1~~TRINITY_DN1815_c0_g1_i2.p2  ORF type:complete len:144 (+),score=2.62 TRINITY_DN1815_c0_g1_i2:356-787(+)
MASPIIPYYCSLHYSFCSFELELLLLKKNIKGGIIGGIMNANKGNQKIQINIHFFGAFHSIISMFLVMSLKFQLALGCLYKILLYSFICVSLFIIFLFAFELCVECIEICEEVPPMGNKSRCKFLTLVHVWLNQMEIQGNLVV